MVTSLDGEAKPATESWDRLLRQLAAHPRRRILLGLLQSPDEHTVPLPEGAMPAEDAADPERASIALRHHHLPSLAEAGYVRWSDAPFSVSRGPRFEEPEAFFRFVQGARDEFPDTLWSDTMEETFLP